MYKAHYKGEVVCAKLIPKDLGICLKRMQERGEISYLNNMPLKIVQRYTMIERVRGRRDYQGEGRLKYRMDHKSGRR